MGRHPPRPPPRPPSAPPSAPPPTVGVGVERRREHAIARGTDGRTDESSVRSRGGADQDQATPEPEFDRERLAAARTLFTRLKLSFRRVVEGPDGEALLAGDYPVGAETERRWKAEVARLGPELLHLERKAHAAPPDPPEPPARCQQQLPLAPPPDLEGLGSSLRAVAGGSPIADATDRLCTILGDSKLPTRRFVERALLLVNQGYLPPAEVLDLVGLALQANPLDRGTTFTNYGMVAVVRAEERRAAACARKKPTGKPPTRPREPRTRPDGRKPDPN
ncbi:MAG: hypothetical protein U0790_00270 [Isosphaeraceae bacterium]